MSYIPSELSILGIAKETVVGTAVVPANYLRVESFKPVVAQPLLFDQSIQASMAKTYDSVLGVNSATYEVGSNLYADDINWWLASILGDVAVTGVADPYSTTHALLNTSPGQPKTYTLTDYNGNNARAFGSARCSSLSVKYSADQLAKVTAQLMAINFATAATPTPSFAATQALASWRAQASINSVSSVLVTDMEWDIKRTVSGVATLSNSQSMNVIYAAGDVEVTGSATLVYDTAAGETVYALYLAGTQVPISLDLLNGANREVKFTSTVAVIDTAAIERTSGKYVDLQITFTGIANATDAGASGGKSPVKALTKAQNPTGTYF